MKGERFDFFEQVFSQLPEEFQFLAEGLRDNVYKAYIINHSLEGHPQSASLAVAMIKAWKQLVNRLC
ncbi:MAG: hypothetical protein IPN76_24790 [Saprospiraceae bacterium]|nr:hypothetical protein [Saprospiraceae bacterium]